MSSGIDSFAVSVRRLVEFCCRRGDIDFRFTPSPTAIEGIEGHSLLYRQRPASYQREFAVEYQQRHNGISLLLRGRADGFDPDRGLVEEIKTCRVDPTDIPKGPRALHRAQGMVYAALIARQQIGRAHV